MQFKRPLLIMEKRCSGIQCWQKYNCERYMQRHERHWSTPHMQGAYMTCGIFFAGGLEMLSWFAPERYMQRHERHWSTPHMQGAYMTCGIFFAGGLEMLSWFAPERLREYYTFQCKHLIPVSGLKNVENE